MPDDAASDYCKIMMIWWSVIGTALAGYIPVAGARQQADVVSQDTSSGYKSIRYQGKLAAAVTLSSTEIGRDEIRSKKPPYRRIRSDDAGRRTFVSPSFFPPGHCGVVDYIEPVMQSYYNDHAGGGVSEFISGMVALPFGRHGEKSFFADVGVAASSGYYPPEKNIAEPVYFRIGLMANDGNHYVITQQFPPQFQVGETVRLNRAGFLEKIECVMHDFGQHNPNR